MLRVIAVKMSFLWGGKHGLYAAASFEASIMSWYLRNNLQNFTSDILYMNIRVVNSDFFL